MFIAVYITVVLGVYPQNSQVSINFITNSEFIAAM